MANTKLKKYTFWYDWRGQESFRDYKFYNDYDAIQHAYGDMLVFRVDDKDCNTIWTRNHTA